MKSKQLANVLIKILGLYLCMLAIPSVVSGMLALFPSLFIPKGIPPEYTTKASDLLIRTLTYAIGCGVQALFGAILIIKSQNIAGFWFKNEDE